MKTLYIHIGYHKTATTSIQSFLANNRKNLLESGYLYPRTGAIDSAHHLLAIAINQNPAFLSMLKKKPIEYWADLKKEAVSSGAETVVLSSEEFSVIKDAGKLQHLHELVKDDFDVKIVVYLRRIDEYAESIYKQLVKFYGSRHQQPFDINADYVVNRIDCYQALMRWANIFGKENIKVRVFEKGQIINNPVYDFLDTVDYSGHLLNTEKTNIKQNFSISTKYTDLLRLVNANTDLSKIIHEKLVDFFVAMSGEETDDYSFLSQQHKEDLIAKSTPFDRKIATEFLGKEDGILYLAQPASTPQYQGIFGTDFDNYNVLSTIQKIFRDKSTTVKT
ncbi:hypothetical protein [uncultured Thiocystis sp.]|jgi:hypothetical protein|uniref:hypothetical protein n=1 Tax=uncultured Thiocystis sp. TaxID=1202134 RepID=UPI0025E8E377|nr:hypothetical protein [uncultured Thiocystis sp.]